MNKTKAKNLKPADLWQLFLMVAVPIICVGGVSLIPFKLRVPLIYITGICSVIMFVFNGKKVKLNAVNVSVFLLLGYLAIQLLYSYDPESTFNLLLIYACSFTLLFIDIPENSIHKIITVVYVFCIVIALSIIASLFIDNLMLRFFGFFVNPYNSSAVTSTITRELAEGTYSGFARERSEAAFIMNIGLAIAFSRFFSDKKFSKKDTLALVLLISALVLTGKRTMFVIPVICFAVFMMVSKIKGKAFKISCVVLIGIFAIFFILMFMPDFANIFYRFLDMENLETLGSRNLLWIYMGMMTSQYWLFGAGFGSYNNFAYDNGLRVYGEKWLYHGHNSYYQVLAELGVVGFTIFIAFLISALFKTLKYLRADNYTSLQKRVFFFAFYIQLMIAVYAVTGNPIYSNQMIFSLFFSTGITLCVGRNPACNTITKHSQELSYE